MTKPIIGATYTESDSGTKDYSGWDANRVKVAECESILFEERKKDRLDYSKSPINESLFRADYLSGKIKSDDLKDLSKYRDMIFVRDETHENPNTKIHKNQIEIERLWESPNNLAKKSVFFTNPKGRSEFYDSAPEFEKTPEATPNFVLENYKKSGFTELLPNFAYIKRSETVSPLTKAKNNFGVRIRCSYCHRFVELEEIRLTTENPKIDVKCPHCKNKFGFNFHRWIDTGIRAGFTFEKS